MKHHLFSLNDSLRYWLWSEPTYIFNVLNKEHPEGIATADSYSAATRTVILDSLPGQFTTDDMKAIAVKVGKTLRTV